MMINFGLGFNNSLQISNWSLETHDSDKMLEFESSISSVKQDVLAALFVS